MRYGNVDSVIVGQPEFYKEVDKSLKKVSLDDWKVYLRWNLVNTFASYLSKPFEKEHFNFFGTVMNGVKEQRPRWKRVLDEEEGAIGDMLGQLYVKKFVSPAVKKRYQDLTNNIIQAYRERIHDLTWMSDSTKAKALVKLNSITTKVAYPDKWKDYTALKIDRSSYVMNVLNANGWAHDFMASKLGKPVDRTEWDMTPQTYNAYYNPSNNEIVLPAAIFIIPGMEDTLADDAIIYGYAGASTIGHEITHGFDDQGRQFDEKGNLTNWWTANDEKEFAKRADLIVKQFNAFKVLDSLHVNGAATQGENIADLGGVVLGYQAFKKTEQYKSGKKINGLTPDQRYFLGYALSWVGKMRDETLALRLMTDVHAPNFLRINGPMANIPEFYKAFGIKEGSAMYQPDSLRVNIW
jgi:putative endopeptidase